MIPASDLLTIALMATVTYSMRVGGYFLLRNRSLSPRAEAVMQAAPGCVLISVISPAFVSPFPGDLIALAITIVAATRLPLLATMVIGVAASGILRAVLG